MDPQMMQQFAQALQRLPRGQLQRLQAIMQRAMSGKDVTREAQEFEQALPLEFQEMLRGFKMPGMPDLDATASQPAQNIQGTEEMTEDQAREIVAQAAAAGKISADEAEGLLKTQAADRTNPKESGGIGRFWRGIKGSGKDSG
jgi:hypothetical protein